MRVLVAEDERVTRAALQRQLEAWGYAVVSAEDGQAAWDLLAAGEFDIVITDWEMPRLSGPDLVRRIRAAGQRRFVYTVMLTGRGETADIVAGIEAGADDFVAKPFQREELRVRLLAGERIVRLERTLSRQNAELRQAEARLRRDLEAAARVQRGTLPPRNLSSSAFSTAWKYVPSDALGGDALGLHVVDHRFLIAYVVDVAGHGVPAALLAVTVTHALAPEPAASSLLRAPHGLASPLGPLRPPDEVARELNARFPAHATDGRFLTMALCVLDLQTGNLHIGLAGHPPPVILRRGRLVPVGETDGMPIGVAADTTYRATSVQLEPGDRVLIYSDGIVEQTDAGGRGMFGIRRLEELALALADEPLARIVERTVDYLSSWSGADTFADDVSIISLEWSPPPHASPEPAR